MRGKNLFLVLLVSIVCISLVIAADSNDTNTTGNYTNEDSILITIAGDEVNITQNITENITENITICNETQCDEGCVKCSDLKCYNQSFVCNESLVMEKFSPNSTGIGASQFNILLRNTGNVDLFNITAELSGNGIRTTEKIGLDRLVAGDKDYVFVKFNASVAGDIDLVVKIFVGDTLKEKSIEQLFVKQEQIVENKTEVNTTALSNNLDDLKEQYRVLEEEYQNKKLDGYPVDIIYDSMKETSDYIKDARLAFFQGDYKTAENNMKLAEEGLANIDQELKTVKKIEPTFFSKIQNNLLLFGSIAAALASLFTVYGIVRSHINKNKIKEIRTKLNTHIKKGEDKKKDGKEEQ